MATSKAQISSVDDLDVIVDADCHVQETVDHLLPYMDDGPAKDMISHSPIPLTEIYGATTTTPTFVYDDIGDQAKGNILQDAQALDDLLDLRQELDIGPLAINPTLNLLIGTIQNDQFAVAIAEAYNRWIIDEVDGYEDIKANLVIPPQKPDKAAEMIDNWANDKNICGVQLVSQALVPPPGHEWYDPIYEASEKHDLPISMHSGSGGSQSFANVHHWSETFAEDHTVEHPFEHMWNLTTMIFRGVPERYPDLTFIFQEAGIGYVPYITRRMDDHYLEFGYELPALEKLPSEYINDQFYFTTQPLEHTTDDPEYIAYMIKLIGEENVMFSADIPHADFDNPEELFDRIQSEFDDDVLTNIMGETAQEVYGL